MTWPDMLSDAIFVRENTGFETDIYLRPCRSCLWRQRT